MASGLFGAELSVQEILNRVFDATNNRLIILPRLANAEYLVGRNAADGADVNLLRVNSDDELAIADVDITWEAADDATQTLYVTPGTASREGRLAYNAGATPFWSLYANNAEALRLSDATLDLRIAGLDLDINAGFIQLSNMAAPGAGAADHVRIYAEDTAGLLDLSAVFDDGTIVDFAEEV